MSADGEYQDPHYHDDDDEIDVNDLRNDVPPRSGEEEAQPPAAAAPQVYRRMKDEAFASCGLVQPFTNGGPNCGAGWQPALKLPKLPTGQP